MVAKAVILAALLLAGCAGMPAPVEDPRQIWCDTNKPRRDATDETPRAELDEINSHNARGVLWCSWSP